MVEVGKLAITTFYQDGKPIQTGMGAVEQPPAPPDLKLTNAAPDQYLQIVAVNELGEPTEYRAVTLVDDTAVSLEGSESREG